MPPRASAQGGQGSGRKHTPRGALDQGRERGDTRRRSNEKICLFDGVFKTLTKDRRNTGKSKAKRALTLATRVTFTNDNGECGPAIAREHWPRAVATLCIFSLFNDQIQLPSVRAIQPHLASKLFRRQSVRRWRQSSEHLRCIGFGHKRFVAAAASEKWAAIPTDEHPPPLRVEIRPQRRREIIYML
jgi:hypothetical protein